MKEKIREMQLVEPGNEEATSKTELEDEFGDALSLLANSEAQVVTRHMVKKADGTLAEITEAKDEKEPTYAEIKAQVAELRGVIPELREQNASLTRLLNAIANGEIQLGPASEKAKRETGMQKIRREAEEGRSPEQLKKAEDWVIRQMGGRLAIQQGPDINGVRLPEIIFDKYVVTPEHRAAGRTKLDDGFTVCINISAFMMARYYIDIILDESYNSDAEKLLAIVADSERRRTHILMFTFLFDKNGELKPLKRNNRRKKKK